MVSKSTHLCFDSDIGSQKPESIINTAASCPFCAQEKLEGIIERRGQMLLVKNKYPVLKDAFQMVLIETENCFSELSLYDHKHLHDLLNFGIEKWLELKASGQFASVLFYKNHGPLSGGTIRHPHMQIVGLKYIDYQERIKEEYFTGIFIHQKNSVELNLSIKPRVGFFEFNIILGDLRDINDMADHIQIVVTYALNHFNKKCNSYNIFFYQYKGKIIAKIMPRFVTSPIFIGYSIPHISNRLNDVVCDLQELYF